MALKSTYNRIITTCTGKIESEMATTAAVLFCTYTFVGVLKQGVALMLQRKKTANERRAFEATGAGS